MSEQQKQTSLWPAVVIPAIILAAIVIWAVVKQRPAEQLQTEHQHHHQHSTFESFAERTDDANEPRASLNDVIKTARTWGPSYSFWYGKMAPDFTLTDITGKQHKLSDYRGKNVMIIFWTTWCPPCRMEIPHLIALRNRIGEDKLAMLAISNEDPALVKKFVDDQRLNYTILLEKGNMPNPFGVIRIYRTSGLPCSFFIDPDGKIKLATTGLLSLGAMKAIVQAE